jgi:putative aminopeptidase FrvX
MNSAEEWSLLEELCALHAVSGREDAMTRFVRDAITPVLDDVVVDNLGNVTGIMPGSEQPEYRLMLQAHMDELGLIVRNVTPDGFLLFERVGGVPEKSLLGQRVDVLTDADELVPGYVATKSHHITSRDEKFVVPNVHDMYIDVGLPSREAVAEAGIQVGDPVTYHPNFHLFGDGQICSKALDNRASVYTLLRVVERLKESPPPCTLVFAFTVLEEFSIRGSLPTVTRTRPDAIISLDITIATDTPTGGNLHPVALRGGPAIKMMDFHGRGTLGGMFSSPKLRRFIEGVAGRNGIPLQREVIIGVITDPAFQLYLGEMGYVIAGLSLPHRYSHSSISMCHETDIRQMVDLVTAIAREFDSTVDLTRG